MKKIIKKWLGIKDLEIEYQDLSDRYIKLYEKHSDLTNNVKRLKRPESLIKDIDSGITALENLRDHFGIGADISVNQFDESWAVICISGKQNIVKFSRLGHRDAKNVIDFLKQFDIKNQCLDFPPGYRI